MSICTLFPTVSFENSGTLLLRTWGTRDDDGEQSELDGCAFHRIEKSLRRRWTLNYKTALVNFSRAQEDWGVSHNGQ